MTTVTEFPLHSGPGLIPRGSYVGCHYQDACMPRFGCPLCGHQTYVLLSQFVVSDEGEVRGIADDIDPQITPVECSSHACSFKAPMKLLDWDECKDRITRAKKKESKNVEATDMKPAKGK